MAGCFTRQNGMIQGDRKVQIISETALHEGFMSLSCFELRHSLYRGGFSNTLYRELLQRRNAVAVIPYDPNTDQIILIEQFRVGAIHDESSAWLTEIVAGEIETGEEADAVARRETMEEAGCEMEVLMHCLDFYLSPGGSSEKISLFCGRADLSEVGGLHGLEDENEDIQVSVVSLDAAINLVDQGKICSAIPIIAIQWLAANRNKVRTSWGFGG